MSEFHPNRTPLVRTRPKLTARRILECWPLLVWAGVAGLAFFIYRGGVAFARMNGAVDVYQENITPLNDGRLKEIYVTRGTRVPPGTKVALMDPAPYHLELESLKREIIAQRTDDINDYDLEIYKLESDLRDIQNADAEDTATMRELQDLLSGTVQKRTASDPLLTQMLNNPNNDTLRARVDLAKAKGRSLLTEQHLSQITEAVTKTRAARSKLVKEVELISKPGVTFEEITKAAALRAEEERQYTEVKTQIDQCTLITPHGGIVDRLDKEVGEYVKVGEGVLKIVGDPEEIVAFLPQDQAGDLDVDDVIWVASTSNKFDVFPSIVKAISPRINNLADSTSPLPNQRVHGRDLIIKYPDGAVQNGKYKLLPGQTVIVHREKPGSAPWIDRIFPSDDSNKVR